MPPAETPSFNQPIDPVYELLRKAVDAGRRTGQERGSMGAGHDKPFSSAADRNWSQVIGQMGILRGTTAPHHIPRGRSSASSSGSSSCASAHLLSVLNSQPSSSSGNTRRDPASMCTPASRLLISSTLSLFLASHRVCSHAHPLEPCIRVGVEVLSPCLSLYLASVLSQPMDFPSDAR